MGQGSIILFTTDFPPSQGGGICTHSDFLVGSLRPLGWEFIVCSEYYISSSKEEINQYSIDNNIKIYKSPNANSVYNLVKKILFIYNIVLKHNPDIIMGSGRHPVWFAAVVAFLTRTMLVTIGHGTEFTEKTSRYDFMFNRIAFSCSDMLISVSNHTENIAKSMRVRPKQSLVIHNPADEKVFRKLENQLLIDFKKDKGLVNKRIILTVGALSERKGQKVCIKALQVIKTQHPDILYVAVGLPTKIDEMKQLAESIGVSEYVLFPGLVNQNELVLWLNICELFVMTSINVKGDFEGYGIAVLEAALCGKASVVSNSGGLKEAVYHEETGIIVDEGNFVDTARAICRLLDDPNLLSSLSINAYNNVLKNGSRAAKAAEYDRAFHSLVSQVK